VQGDFRTVHKQSDEVLAQHFVDWLKNKNLTTIFVATNASNKTFAKIKGLIEGTAWPLSRCPVLYFLHCLLLAPLHCYTAHAPAWQV